MQEESRRKTYLGDGLRQKGIKTSRNQGSNSEWRLSAWRLAWKRDMRAPVRCEITETRA
jgi:hypothetical protein